MDLEPQNITTLDAGDTRVISWSRIRDLLMAPSPPDEPGGYFPSYLSTVRPDGRPHTTGVGVRWYEGDLYFLSGPASRKAKDLAANPASTIAAQVDGLDIVFDGSASPTNDPATMAAVGDLIRQSGWPVEVTVDGFTAPFGPSGDPKGPWQLYCFVFNTAIAQGEEGTMRWCFERQVPYRSGACHRRHVT